MSGARVIERALACLLLVPSLAYVALGTGGAEAWWLVLLALVAPRVIGGRDDARVWAAGATLGFALPLWPAIAGVLGFQLERVLVHGALACLLWRGAARPSAGGSFARWARLALVVWAAWSIGAALRGWHAALPEGAPWLGEQVRRFAGGMLVQSSMVAPTRPLDALVVRLETIALAWTGLQIGLRRPDLRRAFSTFAAIALVLGFATAVFEMMCSAWYRGEPTFARLAAGVGRMHRPQTDHNALGSALVLLLPCVAALAWSLLRQRGGGERRTVALGAFCAAALALGATLLVTSRSKSALGAVLLTALVVVVVRALFGTARARRVARTFVIACVVVVIGVNVLPPSGLRRIGELKYGDDALRLVHRQGLLGYLRANRAAVWEASARMIADRPVAGLGYGRYPAELVHYRDPKARSLFNPLHENAHNQWMQIAAEEGLAGLALALVLVALALAGGVRAWRAPPDARRLPYGARDPDAGLPWLVWTAGLGALVVNLVAGHALLVPTVAHLFGGWLGVLLAAGATAGAMEGAGAASVPTRAGRLALAGAAAFALALAPATRDPRPPLEGFAVGAFAWLDLGDATPDRARMLEPTARWIERWESGARMIVGVYDVRPAYLFPEPQRMTLALNGERVVVDHVLPQSDDPTRPNPLAFLKLDRPAGVEPGDLVVIDVAVEIPFCASQMFDTDYSRVGLRQAPVVFR